MGNTSLQASFELACKEFFNTNGMGQELILWRQLLLKYRNIESYTQQITIQLKIFYPILGRWLSHPGTCCISLGNWVWSLEPASRSEERAASINLSSEVCTHALACTSPHIHIKHTVEIMEFSNSIPSSESYRNSMKNVTRLHLTGKKAMIFF